MYPEIFKKESSKRTPRILLEPGRIFIMGRSIPDNPGEFFRPVLEWISLFAKENSEVTEIDLGFEYINTSSTKWIFTIVKELAEMKDIETKAKVTWYYEHGDDDLCELGFILRSLVDCPFLVVEVKSMGNGAYEKILSAKH
jgi:Ran GTPase-activating protein (RanGAP) involved in mRNA processing and transport